jgi:hypothetical protein
MQLEFGGRRYLVAAGAVVIGSGSDSTLVLAAPGVLPRHAVIRPLGSGMAVMVPALPGAEILVNGARLGSDPTPLKHGDIIPIGGCAPRAVLGIGASGLLFPAYFLLG